jgi:hypothetical protein
MHSSCDNAKPTSNGVSVLLPDGRTMRAMHTAELPIQELPHAARQAHLFPALSSGGALLSIGQSCDHGCQAIFNASTVNIIKNSKTILKGHHNPTNGMWVIQLPTKSTDTHRLPSLLAAHLPQQAVACNATEHKTKADLVTFLHATSFSPATSTFLQALSPDILRHGPISLLNSSPNIYPNPLHSLKATSANNIRMCGPPNPNRLPNLFSNASTNALMPSLPTSSNLLAKSTLTYLAASQSNPIAATNTFLSSTTTTATQF